MYVLVFWKIIDLWDQGGMGNLKNSFDSCSISDHIDRSDRRRTGFDSVSNLDRDRDHIAGDVERVDLAHFLSASFKVVFVLDS